VEGKEYTWKDLFERTKGKMRGDIFYDVPSTYTTILYFLMDILVFSILAWYFDHVDSSNRGKSYGKLFFLEKSYWIGNSKETEIINNSDEIRDMKSKLNADKSNIDSISSAHEYDSIEIGLKTVLIERLKQLEGINVHFNGLRIYGVSKTFTISNGCCGNRNVYALKDTYFEIPQGELFTILGHNGAGKSTLINILTGNISPSSGTARINNIDLIFNPKGIEDYIGLCPQHDILWEELTASEHIRLYASLRSN
jgi:ABC-type multidrug transport system fused ATPase/permease subunit